MNDEVFDAIQGQMHALSMVLITILSNQDSTTAAHMATQLKLSQLEEKALDLANATQPHITHTRNALIDGYLELLRAVSDGRYR